MTAKYALSIMALFSYASVASGQTSLTKTEVFRDVRSFHVGDEFISSWESLYGPCISVALPNLNAADSVAISYRPYGLEKATVRIGETQVHLPSQIPQPGKRNPNYWGYVETVSMVMRRSVMNEPLWLCAGNVAPPNRPTDLDDFMLSGLTITVSSVPVQPLASTVAPFVERQPSAEPAPVAKLSNPSVEELQAELEKRALRVTVLKELMEQQAAAKSGMGVISRDVFRRMVAELEAEMSNIQKTAQSRYSTSIRPNNASLELSARDKSKSFPPVPYYVAGQVGNGEFWLEPIVKDTGELIYRLNFVDPSEQNERVSSSFDLSLDELVQIREALERVHDWSETAKENKVRMRYEKSAVCFPSEKCEQKVTGNTSTEVVFLIYEDGATGAQIIRNKGAFAERYTMSMESASMLSAYLDYVDAAAKQEYNSGSLTKESLDQMFD